MNQQLILPIVVAVLCACAILSFVAYFMSRGNAEANEVARRLSAYMGGGQAAAPEKVSSGSALRDAVTNISSALNPVLERGAYSGKLADDLQKADLRMKPSEWLLAVIGLGVLIGLIVALRFGVWLLFLAGPIATWILSGVFLKVRQSRRTKAFNNQLGDTIVLLSNALKAGLSFAQAMATVAKNASPPISEEFARATREIALGIPVDDALTHMVDRNKSEDFDLLVTAVQIQRVVGGNLAEILDTIAYTIRERVRIQGEIQTLTAQARISGIIITLLPIGLALFLAFIEPSYFEPMVKQTAGWVMLGIGVVMIGIGTAIIQKIVNIEV